ncbi:MAG: excinuclease ABC subunit UvrA [Deltaproteobacteria bacterium]|nr:MAG: excinuclease ABC subunit UvrA [Deltaproteobacteria bacterium]
MIRIRGARQNNLANLDVTLPRGRLTVVTGVSGSGKSSLAFDTLYAEGQRRYVESFSTYARQFLERMDRPDVDAIDGLLPAVALEQKNSIRSSRSTLGTLTEATDYLKALFAKLATLHCEVCGEPVEPDLPGRVADELLAAHAGRRLMVSFPFRAGHGEDAVISRAYLVREGYHRLIASDGAIVRLDGETALATLADTAAKLAETRPKAARGAKKARKGAAEDDGGLVHVLVDRLAVRDVERSRLVEALEAAYRMGHGEAALHLERDGGGFDLRDLHLDRRHCGVAYPEPTEGTFSFNSPIGACESCKGFGRVMSIDMDRVIPDRGLSLAMGAISPWVGPKRAAERRWLRQACEAAGVSLDVPFEDLPPEHQRFVLEGDGGHRRRDFTGVRGWFDWLESKSYKMHVRVFLSRYRAYLPCTTCGGTRFKPEARRFRLGGLTVDAVLGLTVRDARAWLAALPPTAATDALAPVRAQLGDRLRYLEEVGIGYLTLDRQARTLSGGEVQRANLTSALGSGLVNTLFVLDEPTIGLHAADSERLAAVLAQLTGKDNTVVLVEHDPDMLRVADHVVELGPGPGAGGGKVVFSGPPAALAEDTVSTTARALAARRGPRDAASKDWSRADGVHVVNARANNLRGVDVRFPFGKLSVITGVSGSGKSTLLDHVLYRGWLRSRGRVTDRPGEHDRIDGLDRVSDVVWIDQTAPGASSRANPATYVKAWDGVRTLFARQPLAKERGYTAGTFSFNAGDGRCPACEGAGTERVEMQFLADVFLRCELCEGKRFKPEVLEVTWKGRSVADVLDLTIDEAATLFGGRSQAGKRLVPLQRVGLGYLRLGQALNTLSGGEAQRLKLAQHLDARQLHTLFLLDEPTTGLHLADVDRLVDNLRQLTAAGHTVVVIEHHLDVIAAADHVIDLGPEGGDRGGELVFSGPPAALTRAPTATGEHLRRWLAGIAPLDRAEGVAEPAAIAYDAGANGVISIEGARVHNLKSVDVELPRGKRTVISGVSGSGKSSLAFDIVFAEGQRRFLDCLSAYARQYITQLGRPDADRVEGIPPTVAIEQRTTRGGSRSNVANVTEIEPFLRLLYARLGEVRAEGVAGRLSVPALAEHLELTDGARPVVITAPVVQQRQGLHKKVFARAVVLGMRVYVDGTERAPSPPPRLRQRKHHDIDLIVGEVRAKDRAKVAELIARAAELGEGQVKVYRASGGAARLFEVKDPGAQRRSVLDPRYFSPRTALGQCPTCTGAGEDDDGRVCRACEGTGLGPIGRSIELGGATIPELLRMTAPELVAFLDGLVLETRGRAIAEGPVKAIRERASFLDEVGLGYLTLERRVPTLSGGEAQRIRLAAQLGAHLSGVLYVLDEPTIGLHPTDTEVLLRTLDTLQERGNGIIMVEHDETTLRTADVLIDVGPGAGVEGGEVLAAGPLATVLESPRSITGRCLREPRPPVRSAPRPLDGVGFVELVGVTHNNLRGVDVRVPRGRLTVVTGVSGSGKSSLVEVLTKAVAPDAGGGTWRAAGGLEGLDRLVEIDDKPIGKNPRSTPATYVKVWDPIRRLFAQLPESKVRGWEPGRFSFNVKGGRCDACDGNGLVKLEMSFLPDAWVACDACGGRRFNRQTLQVAWDGLDIHQVLELPVREALAVFDRVPQVKRRLQLMDDVGLGYLALGQPSPTLSGGEAQRIKLVSELVGRGQPNLVVVLDEPSIGLHMADVPRLMEVVHRLVDAGATVLVIEHNPDVMREADWIIDLGPGAGADGGQIIYQGPFAGLKKAKRSRTGTWLAKQPAA